MELAVMEKSETLGERIAAARKAKDWNQADLAKRLGISRAAVGQWEIGTTSPSIAKINDVAKALGVAPEWLSFGVKPGEPRVVYRNPERDNIIWVSENIFGESPSDRTPGDQFGLPADFITRELHANPECTIVTKVNSHSVEPHYEYGDRVFVDTSDRKPSPGGVFLYWDGVSAAFANMQIVPRKDAPLVRISAKGQDTIDLPLGDVEIIGRVKGRLQRG